MKKNILVLALFLSLLLIGSSLVFADTQATGNRLQLYTTANSIEELLELKLSRIGEMVSSGIITQEQGDAYALIIQERMNNCANIGENRDNQERLAIGFGRRSEKCFFNGRGNRFGYNR